MSADNKNEKSHPKWVDLEHRLWRQLQELELTDKKILVGFSGGLDSLALLWALSRVKKQNIIACTVHHGTSNSESTTQYRKAAVLFCKEFCARYRIPWILQQAASAGGGSEEALVCTAERPLKGELQPQAELRSEAELRDFRHQALEHARINSQCEVIALAHHRDDLLETRVHRLIRGTGPQGLTAMIPLKERLFRPFLKVSKQELQSYLEHFQLEHFEDPSNQDLSPFRNWLRHHWLPQLEGHSPGALQSLAISLENLTESATPAVLDKDSARLSRLELLSLSKEHQKRRLGGFVLSQNKRNFTHAHIEEVLKRLENSSNELRFRVGGIDWCVNAQQIWLENPMSV